MTIAMTEGIVTPLGTMLGTSIWAPQRPVEIHEPVQSWPLQLPRVEACAPFAETYSVDGSSDGSSRCFDQNSVSSRSSYSMYETASSSGESEHFTEDDDSEDDEIRSLESSDCEENHGKCCGGGRRGFGGKKHFHGKPHFHKHENPFKIKGQATLNELDNSEKWTCPSCGNENYKWRFVCNIRRCRQLKPKELLDCKLPKDAWVCFACGNLNFGHRRQCNMRNCRAPRDQVEL
mmetsp:Transcript_2811/g.4440  ORF Transcript_2811/g.4440 Transcript_2811/m.4440 type:complete len:233 (-) Transcript_2811:442-1140(-)|eukprot:CAMPEP_0171498058 /NCGR_PEP_ID=MMETSP0958-20121227/7629_1 /TAXON_ID=87120 /ORGANISM="Aurantiochytrium limacinum, Strain ATCCMYA-1381" /LENGTH=232 /DNA_ID=CAMNT_0012032395 /DNA_START=117 /DNA_END=815 /DNA_ORIENTATION=+